MSNKIETINGCLVHLFGEWKVQSGYGTFPLCKELQAKPATESNGAWVEAVVDHGQITSYHYATETL